MAVSVLLTIPLLFPGVDGLRRQQVELETAKAVALMIGLYCLAWTPYTVLAMIGIYGDQSVITPLASAIPGLIAKSSTIYNPIIYVLWCVLLCSLKLCPVLRKSLSSGW